MDERFQRARVSFVLKRNLVPCSNQLRAILGEKINQNNRKQRTYKPSLPDDDLHSSSKYKFLDTLSIPDTEDLKTRSVINSTPLSSQVPFRFQYSNEKDRQDNQTKQRLKSSLIFIEIWLTIISLTVLLIALYLLFNINQTSITTITMMTTTASTTTTTTSQIQLNQTNSSLTTKKSYYCSGVSSYTLWTQYSSTAITMNIDTSNCSFNSTPLYFTSVDGIGDHYDLIGYTAIYTAKNDSFKVYARSFMTYNSSSAAMLTASQIKQWCVNWFGILD